MLNKENRLNKEKDFEKVFKKGRSFYTKKIGVKMLKNDLNVSRFGIVVSTKVAKKANKRNLLKRRLREVLRLRVDQVKKGFDFMIIALPEAKDLKYQEIEHEIELILRKLKALQPVKK